MNFQDKASENAVARERLNQALERWLGLAAKVRELAGSLVPPQQALRIN